jgi:hypothetical protein
MKPTNRRENDQVYWKLRKEEGYKRVMNKGKTGEKVNLITTEEINMNSLPE